MVSSSPIYTIPKQRYKKPSNKGIFLFALFSSICTQGLRALSNDYELIKADLGLAGVAAIALIVLFFLFLSIRAVQRYFLVKAETVPFEGQASTPSIKRIASTSTKNRCSLTGLFLGSTTIICLLANKAAQGFETVNAGSLNQAVSSLALWFTFLAVLSLFLAPFLRGRALVRIPMFYIAGFALTAFTYKYSSFRIDKWDPFLAMVQ